MNTLWRRILIILAVIGVSLVCTIPLEKHINLGLDLKGGMHLVMQVDTSKLPAKQQEDAILRAIEVLRNRIDNLGVGETVIQRQGENQILVQLPGITDREAALAMVGKVALLEFKLVSSNPALLRDAIAGTVAEGYSLKKMKDENTPILVANEVALKGEYISDAHINFDQFNQPNISLTLSAEGSKLFGELTSKHVGERLAIVVDDVVLSAPNIKEPIMSGTAEITGQFTFDEASQLALQLRSGALPAPMSIAEERTIGPLLGKDSITAGINAALFGTALVFVFMLVIYLLSGMIANIALMLNILIVLGTMGLMKYLLPEAPMTLTLPGIAGIILTIGMAVDANILINERIREEIANGRPLQASVTSGYSKAFSAIFDSNVTTLIAALMLFEFGSGPIKGFAVTLSIGLTASMFTALYVTRTIFMVGLKYGWIKSLPMLKLFPTTHFNFLSKGYIFLSISAILTCVSLFTIIQKKDSAYGIDFAGGQIQEFKFEHTVQAEELRGVLKDIGMNDIVIQQFDKNPEVVILKTANAADTNSKIVAAFKERIPNNKFEILRIENVGPVVGQHLRSRATWAVLLALVGILVYVGFRFKHFDFATASVIALLHDVIVAMGVTVMSGRQIDLLVVTALLTIAGYSINDTIVIYDRVRENMVKAKRQTDSEVINLSINQTLSRTLLTTLATFLVVICLFFFGGEVLNTFSFCLIVGFLCGIYSTIFVVSPIVVMWRKMQSKHV